MAGQNTTDGVKPGDALNCSGGSAVPPGIDVCRVVEGYHEVLYRYAYRFQHYGGCRGPDSADVLQAHLHRSPIRDLGRIRCRSFIVLRNCYLNSGRKRVDFPVAVLDLDGDQIPRETPPPTEYRPAVVTNCHPWFA